MATLSELTIVAAKRYRGISVERLCYLIDGLSDPKMHDGTSLVNWGIQRPATGATAASSSTGATALDLCEALWTPVSTTLDDGEDAWTLSGSLSSNADAICLASATAKVGSASALTLIGTTIEPLDTYTKLMLHANGTDAGTTFTDSSSSGHTLTATGTAQLDTDQKAFGTASLYFPAAGDRISAPDSADWDVGTGAYNFECVLRIETAASSRLLFETGGGYTGGGKGLAIAIISTGIAAAQGIQVYQNGTNLGLKNFTFSTDTNYHVRVSRSGTNIYIFINGAHIGTHTSAGTDLDGGTAGVKIGGHTASVNFTFLGWIDELRFDKGKALSTSATAFTIPTEEYGEFIELQNDPEGITGVVSTEDLDSAANLSTYWGVQFWIRSTKTLNAGDIGLGIYDSTSGADELERVAIPSLNAGEWTKITHKFETASALTSVASIGLIIHRDRGMNAIYVDDVKAIRCRITLDGENRQEGNTSLKIEIPGGVADNTLVATNVVTSTDMTSDTVILMSMRANKFLGYQAVQYLLDNTLACASPTESLYLTADLEADTWHELSLTLGTPAGDGAIISEGLKVIKKAAAPITIWIDNIRRATAVSGNLTGRFYTWVSFYSSKYDRESDLSPISNVVDCQGQAIALTSIPVSADAQVDMRRVYRSQAGGTVPYLDQTVEDNTTTTATVVVTDAAIGLKRIHPSGEAGSGSYNPPFASPYLISYRQTIVTAGSIAYTIGTVDVVKDSATVTMNTGVVNKSMIGKEFRRTGDQQKYLIEDVTIAGNTFDIRPIDDLVAGTYKGVNGSAVAYQIIGDENAIHTSFIDDDNVSRYHGFPAELVQTIPEGLANDKITGIVKVGDAFAITKRFSTHMGEGTTAPWTISKISDSLGCVAQDTMVQDDKGSALWLAGERGVVSCDGFETKTISDVLLELFDGSHDLGFSTTYFPNAHAVYDLKKKWLWMFLTSKGATTNDVALVLDRSSMDTSEWKWYYFTGIEAKCSTILYDDNGVGTIYIGDYDGFVSTLWSGYYDGVQSGTLAGTATGGASGTLIDTGASFYTTGSGLMAMTVVKYTPSTGTFESKKIASNTGTVLTLTGTWATAPAVTDKYYIGSCELDWYSKNFQFTRATDKSLLFDLVVNHQDAATAQNIRVRMSKDLGKSEIANQEVDLSDGEEQVLLVRQRVQQAQIRVNGYTQGQAIEVNSIALRFKQRGIR